MLDPVGPSAPRLLTRLGTGAALLAFVLGSAASAAGDQEDTATALQAGWPEFRGPRGDGNAGSPGLPIRWSEADKVRWKTPIPYRGWSTPVVHQDQVWLTTATTAGSIVGAIVGKKGIPGHWHKNFNNSIHSYLIGKKRFSISGVVKRFAKQARTLHSQA